MRRDAANVLLVLLGGALVKIAVDGTSLRYVKPGATVWVLAAGVVLIGLALIAIARDLLRGKAIDDGHRHGHRPAWLLTLPALAVFVVAPPALGADSVLRAGNRAVSPADGGFPALPAGRVTPMALSEFVARGVWAPATLRGRAVALTGFVVHDGGTDYVARLVITCCAADATPMKVALTGQQAAPLADDQWIEVDGRLRPGSVTAADGYTPTLTVSSLTTATEPADPYEY